jgi:hypothetical protein
MTAGSDADGDDKADGGAVSRTVALERGVPVPVTFAPRQTTILDFALERPVTPVERRPDLGIGADDVVRKGGRLEVTVHSLGAVAAPGGELRIEDQSGRRLATAAIPPLEAPLDLKPRTAVVRVAVPKVSGRLTVRVALPGDAPEITLLNNAQAVSTE